MLGGWRPLCFTKNQHFILVRFWEGGRSLAKKYSLYAFKNVDNFEQPVRLSLRVRLSELGYSIDYVYVYDYVHDYITMSIVLCL